MEGLDTFLFGMKKFNPFEDVKEMKGDEKLIHSDAQRAKDISEQSIENS